MRTLPLVSASLTALLFASAALADGRPSPVIKAGGFLEATQGARLSPSADAVEAGRVARAVLSAEAPSSRGASFGEARVMRLADGSRVVRLEQVHGGLSVVSRGASVVFGPGGAPRLAAAHVEDDLPASLTPSVERARAAEIAGAAARASFSPERLTLGVWPGADGARLAWFAQAIPTLALPYAPLAVVDAMSGELVVVTDTALSVDKAKMYPTNPVKSPELADVTVDVTAGQTALVNELVESHNCIDEKKVVSVMGFLQAHTCSLKQTAVADSSGDYLYEPPASATDPEDPFSELSLFYHVNRIYGFFRGFSPDLKVQGSAIAAVSNLRIPQGFQPLDTNKLADPDLPLQPFQNAFFAPDNPLFSSVFMISGGAMWFGQGPKADYSYDGDVVYHEFTHATVNATIKLVGTPHADKLGLTVSPGAMNEGLADFFSSALAGDPDVGEYASTDLGSTSGKAIRSLTAQDSCPASLGGEVHQDATLFSGALWDARSKLAEADQKAFDLAIFTAMAASPTGDLGYEDLAQLFVAGVKSSPLGDAAASSLEQAFTARGVLPACNRVFEYAGMPLSGPKQLYGDWVSLGTQTAGLKKPLGYAPGIVQFHTKLPAGATQLTVSFKEGALALGAASNPFGGGGTPFAPQVLVRFGADPITFSYKPYAVADGVVQAEATKDKSTYAASVEVPEASAEAYVMIVNTGDQDGSYYAVELKPAGASPGEGGAAGAAGSEAGGASGGGGSPSAGSAGAAAGGSSGAGGQAAAPTAAAPLDEASSGCGCALPGQQTGAAGGLAALLALGALARRRRGLGG